MSGRGVGMDAVRANVRELGGDVRLESEHGAGPHVESACRSRSRSCARCSSAAPAAPFAIPLDRVERTVRLDDHVVRSVRARPCSCSTAVRSR